MHERRAALARKGSIMPLTCQNHSLHRERSDCKRLQMHWVSPYSDACPRELGRLLILFSRDEEKGPKAVIVLACSR